MNFPYLETEGDMLDWLAERHGEAEVVAASRVPPERICGVYFLIRDEKIVYIGQSVNIPGRLEQHLSKGLRFDSYAQILCAPDMLYALERSLIYRFKPEYNRQQKRITVKSIRSRRSA